MDATAWSASNSPAGGVSDPSVFRTKQVAPRHRFIPAGKSVQAHEDHPLPIGFGQTISPPYIGVFMAQALQLQSLESNLEIGTGSGSQAAILERLVKHVGTIAIVREPGERTTFTIVRHSAPTNYPVKSGDRYDGSTMLRLMP